MNDYEYWSEVGKRIEKYPQKRERPFDSDRPTAAQLEEFDMKQESLSLKEPPVKGDPDKDTQKGPPVENSDSVHATDGASAPILTQEQPMAATVKGDPGKVEQTNAHQSDDAHVGPVANVDRATSGGSTSGDLRPALRKEQPMAATPALMNESRAKELAAPLMPVADQFTLAIKRLDTLPLTRMTVETAKELDAEASTYIEKVKGSELRRQADAAHNVHRFLTGMLSRLLDPADNLRKRCSRLFADFDRQERARVAEEGRRREEAIRKANEEARRAEIEAARASEATTEEIEALEAAPMPVVAAPAAKEEVKIQGVSLVYSAKLTRIKDPMAFTKWLAEHSEHIMGFEIKTAYWKTILTGHLDRETGTLSIEIPGVEIEVTSSSRHTKDG